MANNLNDDVLHPGAFSLSWAGGLQYGSREMSFDGDSRFYFAKGDTINDDLQTGIGVFVLDLQNRDIQDLKDVAEILCGKDIQTGGPETHDPAATFNIVCLDNGKAVSKSGSLRLIPERLKRRVLDTPFRLAEQARTQGRKLIKLDFTTLKIERKSDRYVVSVRFINSGIRWIRFKTSDQWPGNTIGGELGVAPFSKIGAVNPRDDWGFPLSGQKLTNLDEFPDGVVSLNPGEGKILRFETVPDSRIVKGDYELSGAAFMRIEYEGYGWGLSTQVDFRPIKTRLTFDHDYPSTPEEREQWEAKHRADMSLQPILPAGTFPENGLYRAARVASGAHYRSLNLKPFKAGDVATTDNVKMPMEQGNGVEINGPVQWVWEGSAPTPTSPSSFDCEDGTQHHCMPGATCPRSGRWIARLRTGPLHQRSTYRYDMTRIVALRRGQPMPATRADAGDTDWEWIGA
ncbi:hypothetical protein EVC45_14615 [Paraburkholderia sp. UYCP14C]|uniref:hypothetical protein n=1 Tax=Paraburkholderia sp. UYCP14C TaxID=2511130 RepID=UPI0010210D8E|nr:hypothetical protein [Paraburkholderia sp. UYCP14C]RZF29040.1 hypothetical protein EVC45_14615 [Paraburkholderia sp. UYCP14C]